MYCTKCGVELQETAVFCSKCGNQIAIPAVSYAAAPARLTLDKRNKRIGGVCAGFARHFDVDVTLMRLAWLSIAVCTGVGFGVYLAAWIILPSDFGDEYPRGMSQVPAHFPAGRANT